MGLEVSVVYPEKVNWSLLRAGVPLIWSLKFKDHEPTTRGGLSLRISCGNLLDTSLLTLSDLPPETHQWGYQPNYAAASRLQTPLDTHLLLEIGDRAARLPVWLLTADEWYAGVRSVRWGFELDSRYPVATATFVPGDGAVVPIQRSNRAWRRRPQLQCAAAALIQPEHPRLRDVKRHAERLLSDGNNAPVSLPALLGSKPEKLLEKLYQAMCGVCPHKTHDIEKFSLQSGSQRIRGPGEALSTEGGATCVDLVLAFAGALELAGLSPLFILVRPQGEPDLHALAGCILDRSLEFPKFCKDAQALHAVIPSKLRVVDVTGFTQGQDFPAACKSGEDLLSTAQFFYAIDIAACRSGVLPLPWVPWLGKGARWRTAPALEDVLPATAGFMEREPDRS